MAQPSPKRLRVSESPDPYEDESQHIVRVEGTPPLSPSHGDIMGSICRLAYFPQGATNRLRLTSPSMMPDQYYLHANLAQYQPIFEDISPYLDMPPDYDFGMLDYKIPMLGTMEPHAGSEFFILHAQYGSMNYSMHIWKLFLFWYSDYIRYSFMLGTFVRGYLEFFIYFWLPPEQVHPHSRLLWTQDEFQWAFDFIQDQGEYSDIECEAITELTFWWQYFKAEAPIKYMP